MTRYWLGTSDDFLDNPANWDGGTLPIASDDLVFNAATPNYVQPAIEYGGGLDGITFGTILASDGSNCLDGGMIAGEAFLTGGSNVGEVAQGGTCSTLSAGSDGSDCTFYGLCLGAATFNGPSINNGVVGDAMFNDSSINKNGSGGTVGGNATFSDSSIDNGVVGGNARFNDASSFQSGTASNVVWKSSGTVGEGDRFDQILAIVSIPGTTEVYTPLTTGDFAEVDLGTVVLKTAAATMSGQSPIGGLITTDIVANRPGSRGGAGIGI